LTLSGLKTRFDQYRRGHKSQRTSSRINGRISETLSAGKKVKVLVATPEPSEWQELPVNTAAGLEVGLIEMIRPSWNIDPAWLWSSPSRTGGPEEGRLQVRQGHWAIVDLVDICHGVERASLQGCKSTWNTLGHRPL
jgi:hypothetical protein